MLFLAETKPGAVSKVKEIGKNNPYSVRHEVVKVYQRLHQRRNADALFIFANTCKQKNKLLCETLDFYRSFW